MLLEMPYDQQEQQHLLEYFRLTPSDLKNLTKLQNLIIEAIDSFLDNLYKHYFNFPETASLFPDQAIIDRVKKGQRNHYLNLVSGKVDEDFFQHSWKVGQTHDFVNLEPRWYMGCYAYFLSYWQEEVIKDFGEKSSELLSALARIACLDIGLIWESYYRIREMKMANGQQELEKRHRELKGIYDLTMKAMNDRADLIQRYEKEIAELKNKVAEIQGEKNI